MSMQPSIQPSRMERRLERTIWKFRLITFLPVVMSLLGSISCFVIGTYAQLNVLKHVLQGRFNETYSTRLVGQVVGSIDYYLIGIALLIFGYGIYELVISDIDLRQQEPAALKRNLLNIGSLDGLKQKLTKVIVVALIVSAFQSMVGFEVSTITDLLMFCGAVLMLSFSAWLLGQSSNH